NLSDPSGITYIASLQAFDVHLGKILKQQDQFGSVTGQFNVNGKGLTPASMNTSVQGKISKLGFNQYNYSNITVNGNIASNTYAIEADIRDSNAAMDVTLSGETNGTGAIRVKGMVDSLKTLPLNFTNDPLVMRGKIDGSFT